MNADSGERLQELLADLARFSFFDCEVTPLADFNKSIDRIAEPMNPHGL